MIQQWISSHLQLFLYSLPPHPPHMLGIYLYINFVPGEYFNGLFYFRKPTVEMSPA